MKLIEISVIPFSAKYLCRFAIPALVSVERVLPPPLPSPPPPDAFILPPFIVIEP
jgi:hypothetical protein